MSACGESCRSANTDIAVVDECSPSGDTITVAGPNPGAASDARTTIVDERLTAKFAIAVRCACRPTGGSTDTPSTIVNVCGSALHEVAVARCDASRTSDACTAGVTVGTAVEDAIAVCAGTGVATTDAAGIYNRTTSGDAIAVAWRSAGRSTNAVSA